MTKLHRRSEWPKGVKTEWVPLYGGTLVFCQTLAQWKSATHRIRKKYDGPWPGGFGGAQQSWINIKGGRSFYMIGCFDQRASTLAHECAHCAFKILGNAGVEIVENGKNEAFCYLMDGIMTRMPWHMKRLKRE